MNAESGHLTEADRIAAEFAAIPFDNHEGRILALAYFIYRDEAAQLLKRIQELEAYRRCDEPSPDGSLMCDLRPHHKGPHVAAEGYEWSETRA